MKNFKCIIAFVVLFPLAGRCQVTLAGISGTSFADIIPDTLINTAYNQTEELYYLDIDQDSNNDIKFRSYYGGSFGGGAQVVAVSSLNSNVKLALGSIDSTLRYGLGCMGYYWDIRSILKAYNYSDSISTGTFSPVGSAYLGYEDHTCSGSSLSNQWVNIGDKYLGVSITNLISSITAYGWIKVNVPNLSSCWIKEFSFGNSIVGLNESIVFDEISIYPNPATDIITIKHKNKIDAASLVDVYGKVHNVVLSEKNQINVSELAEGIYILQIKTSEGIEAKKVLVQR